MEDCLFCKIAGGDIPAEIVYSDKHAVAFLDINPKSPGHTVVVPRRHSSTIIDLPESEVGPLFTAVKKVSQRLFGALRADGLNLGVNQNQAGGQVVNHLHIHILPRFKNDGGTSVQGIVNNPPSEPVRVIAEKIRNYKG